MPTLSEYFRTEAREFLTTLDRLVAAGRPDIPALHRATRGLRGSAQMAREERFFHAVSVFESVTRHLAAGALSWSEDMTERARATIADLREMLEQVDTDTLDARAASVAERWQANARAAAPAPPDATGADEFRQFAGREVAEIAAVLDESIQALQSNPMDREPLRAVLRRQRALLGAARLDEIPVIAEILRAVEDLTRVIVKLDVGVKREWLDIYRVARDALQGTIATLLRNENPAPTHALSRLRHMRAELLERYGEGELVSAAHDQGLVQAQPGVAAAAAEGGQHGVSPEPVREPATVHAESEDVLELDASAVVDDGDVLELADDAIVEASADEPTSLAPEAVAAADTDPASDDLLVLELDAADVVEDDGVLELDSSQILDPAEEPPLQRAEQLHAIVARALGDDAGARIALDQLLDLLRGRLE